MTDDTPRGRALWQPHALDRERIAPAITGPAELFHGEAEHFSRRQLRQRVELRDRVAPRLDTVLDEDETILYLAPAYEVPPTLHVLSLGLSWIYFHHVVLVLTDRRLIEVLLGGRGRGVGSRVRSYPWSQITRLDTGWRGLRLFAGKQRKVYKLKIGTDKRYLKKLVPRLAEGSTGQTAVPGRGVPLWHCPTCGQATAEHPDVCSHCGTVFRSGRLAAGLALAFPGAGLLYAGHPILAFFDLVVELVLYAAVVVGLLEAAPGETVVAAAVGAFFFLLTKAESAHLAHLFARRTKPIDVDRQDLWRRFALGGAALSVVAIALPLLLAGRLANPIDRDLDLSASAPGWDVSRDPEEWLGIEDGQRAEWYAEDDDVITAYAFPIGRLETFDDVVRGFEIGGEIDTEPLAIGSFRGRQATLTIGVDDLPSSRAIALIVDHEHDDAHMLILDTAADPAAALDELHEVLAGARWIAATPPE